LDGKIVNKPGEKMCAKGYLGEQIFILCTMYTGVCTTHHTTDIIPKNLVKIVCTYIYNFQFTVAQKTAAAALLNRNSPPKNPKKPQKKINIS
jgi:hypothetical protein